jgi:hypothetical protein
MERIVGYDGVRATEVLALDAACGLGQRDNLLRKTIRLRSTRAEAKL